MALKFKKLTRPGIRNLESGHKITEHGIIFERLEDGDGRYTINVMVDGQRIHRTIGKESEGVTRKQVEDFVEKVKTDSRSGRLNLPKGRKTVLGFRQAGENYLAKLEEEGGNDIPKKRQRLNLHCSPFFKEKPLSSITTFDIERYKKFRLGKDTTAGTINRELAVISLLFNKALEWRWLNHKPVIIKRLKENPGRIIYLTTDQIKKLIEAAKEDQNPHIYPFIVIGLETSMRHMEILSILLENIDLDKRVIFIPQAKAGAREQPITRHLVEFLRGYLETSKPHQEWLFPSLKPGKGHIDYIEEPFRRVVERAGLDSKQVVPHTLRHTAITHLVQAGVDLPTVKRISGHKTLIMVERYSHQNGQHIQTAMDKLEEKYKVV